MVLMFATDAVEVVDFSRVALNIEIGKWVASE